jgi:hypothetical protein
MFELPLLYIHQADRERDVSADLRRRQVLKMAPEPNGVGRTQAESPAPPRTSGTRVRAVER